MFQSVSIQRTALVFASAILTGAAAALARPAMLEDPTDKEATQPAISSMQCKEAIERADSSFPVKFIVAMRPTSYSVTGAQIVLPAIGICDAALTGSNYNALGGTVDVHAFQSAGGKCDAISFTVFHDRKMGSARSATLKLGNVTYNCEL